MRWIVLLALATCAACAGSIYPTQQTVSERCVNADRIVAAMRIGGAWGWSVEQAARDADEICGR